MRCYSLSSGNWSSSAILNEPRRFFKGCPPRCIVGRRLSLRGRFECGARCPRRSAALLPPRPAEAGPAPPAPAWGGYTAEWGRVSPLHPRPRPGRREGEGGRADRPISRRPCPGPAPERGGARRELVCPARALSRPARPSSSGARSRRAFRVSRCSCGNCRLFIPSGEKEGRWGGGPGRLRSGDSRHHLWAWRGERPQVLGRLPLGGFTRKIFTAPQAHVSPTFPFLPFSGELEGGPGRRARTASAPQLVCPGLAVPRAPL